MSEVDNVIPVFHSELMQNQVKSEEQGKPVFEGKDFVQMLIPGNRNEIPDVLVKDEHKRRWPKQYDAFKANKEAPVEGTPIDEWPVITRLRAAELKTFHIFTVEQLAEVSDANLTKIGMDARDLQRKAVSFLESSKNFAQHDELARIKDDCEQKDDEIARLKARVDEVEQELLKLQEGKEVQSKPKRGRPKKAA